MNAGHWIRQFHRWTSAVFMLTVVITSIALAQTPPLVWVSYIPLAPLFVLMLTGMYLFALPYVTKWRNARR